MIEKRPWGTFEVIAEGPGYKVKRLVVEPGQATSLQYHQHRGEIWTIASGVAMVTIGADTWRGGPGVVEYVWPDTPHRLENRGRKPLVVIEFQRGDILDEDDIIRIEDKYGRVA